MTATQIGDPLERAIAASDALVLSPSPVLDRYARVRDNDPRARWLTPGELASDGRIGQLYEEMRAVHGPDHRQAAAQDLLRDLTRDTMYFAAASLYLTRSVPDLDPDNVLFCWRDSRFAMPALRSPRFGVIGGAGTGRAAIGGAVSPLADPLVEPLADEDGLDRWFADRFTATFGPLLDQLRCHTRVGARLIWGYVSDMLHFRMLQVARDLHEDRWAAWRRADRLVATLRDAGAPIRVDPRPFPLRTDATGDPNALWAVRGVCCFDFRADPEHGFCTTCPLERDDVRRPPLAAKFGPAPGDREPEAARCEHDHAEPGPPHRG